jgi:hypothetical protein
MDYIKVINYHLHIIEDHALKIIDEPFTKYINRLLKPYLVNLSIREKMTRRLFGFTNKVPLIINESILLLCIQSYRLNEAFYINYHQILKWDKIKEKVYIYFMDNHCLCLDSYLMFVNQIKKVNRIFELREHIDINL